MSSNQKIAVLIDGDNADSTLVEQIFAEAGKNGKVTIKRIYADWTENRMNKWKLELNKHAIRPIQKFAYTQGKNSTDTALIIDAMDTMHSKLVDGFCIVSSDSDYTGLAHRIREEGLFVMGIGKSHTPEAFVKACESFTYTEVLTPSIDIAHINASKLENSTGTTSKELKLEAPKLRGVKVIGKLDLIDSLKKSGVNKIDFKDIDSAFNMVIDINTGHALLSRFSEALRKVNPTFDHRNYGFQTFRLFCENLKPNYSIILHKDGQTISIKRSD